MFTADEVIKALATTMEYKSYRTKEWTPFKDEDEDEYDPDYPDFYAWDEIEGNRITLNDEKYEIDVVDETGGMDEGSNRTITFRVGDQYFRKSGFYASHYGTDWDGDFEEVVPTQQTVTVYKTK